MVPPKFFTDPSPEENKSKEELSFTETPETAPFPGMLPYDFVEINPRTPPEEVDYDLGIEITEPKLLKEGVPNLDHHGPGTDIETPSACEQALNAELPPEKAKIATVRLDPDSLTAMAVLAIRKKGDEVLLNRELVHLVGRLDRLGPRELQNITDTDEEIYLALSSIAFDRDMDTDKKVELAVDILQGRYDPKEVKQRAEKVKEEKQKAREASEIMEIVPQKLVVVISKDRFATQLGYEYAPVVIAFNPEMPVLERGEDGKLSPTGETYKKFTVCKYDEHVPADLEGALKELQQAEENKAKEQSLELKGNWGGRNTIFGSPQNRSSLLSLGEVIDIVKKHLS